MDPQFYINKRDALLVQVSTDAGLVGIGESAVHSNSMAIIAAAVKELASWIIGENPLYVERIWEKLYRQSMQYGRRGVSIMALSGIDIALWDIIGQAAKLPLYKILGGFQDKVLAYASGGFYAEGKGIDALVAEMCGHVDRGFSAVKMKIGRRPSPLLHKCEICYTDLKEDLNRVKAVREAIGEKIVLMLDANNAWDAKAAIRIIQELEVFKPYFIEEPLPTDDIEGSAIVAHAVDIPIAGYETAYTHFEFRDLIEQRAVDIVQPDVSWGGGITGARKIATIAAAHNMLCIPHSFSSAINLMATLHFVASIPNSQYIEFDQNPNGLRTELLTEPIEINPSGVLSLPDGPGLGVKLNQKTVSRLRIDI
jgi:L-alanine-DL-glutamate epimerase-like enolase superfamily enzyme